MILFISDLHLSPERPTTLKAFLEFLETTAIHARKLYILGDFFDAWVGDDDDTPEYQTNAAALSKLNSSGTEIFFMHGNRDFLLGETYAAQAGMSLLSDPTVVALPQGTALLMHGDNLCTDDKEYQAFRTMVRTPEWQQATLNLPLEERRALARKLRETSKTMSSMKAEDIMDVNQEAVSQVMEANQSKLLIHGHTHRPKRHDLSIKGQAAERIVLGDWDKNGWYLQADEEGLELISFPIEA